jgi:hypothetical protein
MPGGCDLELLKAWWHIGIAFFVAIAALFNAIAWCRYPSWYHAVAAIGYTVAMLFEAAVVVGHLAARQ